MTKQELENKVSDLEDLNQILTSQIDELETQVSELKKFCDKLVIDVTNLGGEVVKAASCIFTRHNASDILFQIPEIESEIDNIYSMRY